MKKKKAAAKKLTTFGFPETLYVQESQDGSQIYYEAYSSLMQIDEEHNDELVAVYQLVHVKTLKVGEKTLL